MLGVIAGTFLSKDLDRPQHRNRGQCMMEEIAWVAFQRYGPLGTIALCLSVKINTNTHGIL